jgi:hypothetical protein
MVTDAMFEQLTRTVQYMKDRQEILDCIVRESRARDRHDAEMITGCYWEDGFDEHGPAITPALKYAEWSNSAHSAGFAATSHNLTNHTCEIDGDTAYCDTYVIGGLLSLDNATCKVAMGRYVDLMERRNGEWRIKLRRSVIDMIAEGDASWLKSRALSGFLRGLRSKEDAAYQRPIRLNPNDARW